MTVSLLSELGKKIAERWMALLVLPGVVYTAAATAAVVLGHRHWADRDLLWRRLAGLTDGAGDGSGRTAVLLTGVLAASLAAAFAARALGGAFEALLTGALPLPRRVRAALTERRRAAWRRLDAASAAARDAGDDARFAELAAARNRVALTEPAHPGWLADRLHAPATRVARSYGLDLGAAWPRLWLLLPDGTRAPLTESRQRYDEAVALGGWALMYGALGVLWWPALVVGAGVALVARRRMREAAEVYAELVEAAVDVHLDRLLHRFDDERRPVRPQAGARITELFRKGT